MPNDTPEDVRINHLVAKRVKALIVSALAVRNNGVPPVILGAVNPAWLLERAANAATAIVTDEFIHVTSRIPAAGEAVSRG